MSARVLHHVTGRLSLRPPQAESLAKLAIALQAAPEILEKERDLSAVLATLKAEFPSLDDFEREFPSLCFALATGVGKTRLMGAFIAYLHLAHGINNFFVLAPNLTIYNKLIADFTPNTPKYVFKGIGEFAINAPRVITGDNYEQQNLTGSELFGDVRINIFNIAKINSEVRGGKEPRIKRMQEVLGDSYFNHLASLPDLVLLMDESHRYRAQAGMRAINELNPLLGLEVTATPFIEAGKGTIPFKNVVMDYPLARAIDDGFVKVPAVVTQRGFNASHHKPEDIERIKLADGIRLHEATKVELLTYARENNLKTVKPFMLVIARDTTHAAQLLALMESEAFFAGRYRGKVIQVDSSKSGKEEEDMVARLLAVESLDEPTEIVIHVNMLKEGWDVTNLYTIVPLRAANARTLVEQSIGRGLRLPYGKRTGVDAVDRLNIVAHDRFQEIIDDCNRADSPLRLQQLVLDAPGSDEQKQNVQIVAGIHRLLGTVQTATAQTSAGYAASEPATPLFVTEPEQQAAQAVLDVVEALETQRDLLPDSRALLQEEVQQKILSAVKLRLSPAQASLLADEQVVDLSTVVAKTTALLISQTIDIPRITVVPVGDVHTWFEPFVLDVSALNLQPASRELVIHNLHSNAQTTLIGESGIREDRLEDYLVHALVDFDDIDYFTQADVLYELAGQVVAHFRGKNLSDEELHNLLDKYRRLIADYIHAQMMEHFHESAAGYQAHISRGFTALKPCHYTVPAGETVRFYRETVADTGRIRQMLFGGFSKCLYPAQKFDSDTERRFAVILERDAIKWFKPVKGQFQIFYRLANVQPEYIPDFVAELDDVILMVETKARNDVDSPEVQAKAAAAVQWCQHASDYTATTGGKPWRYLLIAHDEVTEDKQLRDFTSA